MITLYWDNPRLERYGLVQLHFSWLYSFSHYWIPFTVKRLCKGRVEPRDKRSEPDGSGLTRLNCFLLCLTCSRNSRPRSCLCTVHTFPHETFGEVQAPTPASYLLLTFSCSVNVQSHRANWIGIVPNGII